LDQRILVLRPVLSRNAFNEYEKTFEPFVEIWAGKRDVSTLEAFRAQEVGAQLSARFVVRYSADTKDIDARYVIRHDGNEYEITGVKAVGGRDRFYEIDVVRRSESDEEFEITSP
jgi:SPP1 family predicted phage head-tail adaptor